jgi:hypothetical protein
MVQPKEGRQEDPRGLSDRAPGRSRIQDDAPSLPPAGTAQRKEDEKVNKVGPSSPATPEDLERREARAYSAMPYGRKGSRRGKPAGGGETEEDLKHH